jgi:isopenicillin N synthase-like dioxygenase
VQGSRRSYALQVSKDDILGLSEPLPAPGLLSPHRGLLKSFMQHSHALVNLLLSLLNDRLDLPYDQLPSLHRLASVSGDQVRWVHAPPQPTDDRKTALGQHTDFGSVTILFNRLGGLQVLPPNSNEWSYVKPLRGHAVINLGDAMVKFSAGILRSNIHRVVNPPGQQENHTRMSLVYFARPADDVILKPLDGSSLIDESRRQKPEKLDEEEITSKEWILRRALGRRQGGDWAKAGGTESRRVGS